MFKKWFSANTNDCGCSSSCGCNETAPVPKSPAKILHIDFLYLDLNTCERCMATDETLKKALDVLSGVFDTLGYQVELNAVNITSPELAKAYRFLSSPTIRVNGVDICNEVEENACSDCGDICGDNVDCRVFVYEGVSYDQPPVAMIVHGILKVICGQKPIEKPYEFPENLRKFFAGKKSNTNRKTVKIYDPALCCPTGICGVNIDPELIRISIVLDNVKRKGMNIERFNLRDHPQVYVDTKVINDFLMKEGAEKLPATTVDGEIEVVGAYPSNKQISQWLDIPEEELTVKKKLRFS